MSAFRGGQQLAKARRATKAMHESRRQEEARRKKLGLPPSQASMPTECPNKGEGRWFQVGGEWEDYEKGENCGECEWCDENDD